MKRIVVMSLVLTALAPLASSPAVAGGNWLEFRRPDAPARFGPSRWDIFATGQTVVARVGYLSATFGPTDGPFHLWIERGEALEAGGPIPDSAIRVGTFHMAPSGRGGQATFTMPALPRGTYTLVVCDDPCTTYGFGEYVQGWLTSVPTAAEAQLLARLRELRSERDELVAMLYDDIHASNRREERLLERVTELERQVAIAHTHLARRAAERPAPRPQALIDGAGGAWLAAALAAIAAGWLLSRRRRAIFVPDTPAELLTLDPDAARADRSERVLEDLDV